MEIAFVLVIAAAIGLIIRYLVPGRESHGLLLLPATATVIATGLWAILVWLGLPFDGGWIWVISIGAATLAALLTAVLLPSARRAADERYFETARRAG
ncbi:MAG TPA: hypothetical protein VNQ48_00640 [Microbacteriaceae bacterium]|nr:hypothetical protein [Microbacteriaceae bacterium]